jgi:hypothetical protein
MGVQEQMLVEVVESISGREGSRRIWWSSGRGMSFSELLFDSQELC